MMSSIAIEVKKTLNEYNKFENCDHRRGGNFKDLKCLANVLQYEYGYKAVLVSSTLEKPYNLILRREDNVRRQVCALQRKKTTTTRNIEFLVKKYGNTEISKLADPEIDEICVICPPHMNYDPHAKVVDNTKACFFDIETILNAVQSGELEYKKTREGEAVIIPEEWAKENAKEIITYQFKLI